MALDRIHLRKLLKIMYLPVKERRSALRADIREERARLAGMASSGGDFYVPFWGDADRLPNGNVLVTAGRRGTSSASRVFEVAASDGQVVWELRLPPDFGVYRAGRITPPLVRAIGNAGN